ncbi:MAG: site-2 protease family protein [Chloroflexi bacterium]|nr:site-2 protease family protein [Chloroflexota bacterium]
MPRLSPIQVLVLGGVLLVVLYQMRLFTDPLRGLIWIIAVVVAITVHEANHALVAVKLGDPTPRLMGRVSLNPLRHLDPIGTLMLIVARFGWGKPVLFNPANLRMNPALGSALVSAAGPVANLVTAFVIAGLLKATLTLGGDALSAALVQSSRAGNVIPAVTAAGLVELLQSIVVVNVLLAVFNLLPIPPLDGFGVLMGLAPKPLARALAPLLAYGPLILLGLILLPQVGGPNLLGQVMDPLIGTLVNLALD